MTFEVAQRVEGAEQAAKLFSRAYRRKLDTADAFILMCVAGQFSATPQDLLRLELMSRASVYRGLARLVLVKYLVTRRSETDKRREVYFLTKLGRTVASELIHGPRQKTK